MTHYNVRDYTAADDDADAITALARLRSALSLVEHMAASTGERPHKQLDRMLDDDAALTLAYEEASSVARRRFDTIANEAAGYAAAGLKTLIRYKERTGRECAPAARALADEMDRSLTAMAQIIASDKAVNRF